MKIVTWNVNGIRAVSQKGFNEFFRRVNPDILCLQETKAHEDQLNLADIVPSGYQSFWSAAERPGYSGVVTFCREAPQNVSFGMGIPRFDAEGRLVITKHPGFLLYNIYFPNGGSGPERHAFKQDFLRRLQHHLKKQIDQGERVIVVGDYNVAYLDIDVYDPIKLSRVSGFLPEERAWMEGFLKAGFIDSYRFFHPDEKHRYTWWYYLDKAREGNRGWRIDHICVSQNLQVKLRACDILDQQMGSDHCPVMLELDA